MAESDPSVEFVSEGSTFGDGAANTGYANSMYRVRNVPWSDAISAQTEALGLPKIYEKHVKFPTLVAMRRTVVMICDSMHTLVQVSFRASNWSFRNVQYGSRMSAFTLHLPLFWAKTPGTGAPNAWAQHGGPSDPINSIPREAIRKSIVKPSGGDIDDLALKIFQNTGKFYVRGGIPYVLKSSPTWQTPTGQAHAEFILESYAPVLPRAAHALGPLQELPIPAANWLDLITTGRIGDDDPTITVIAWNGDVNPSGFYKKGVDIGFGPA